MLSLRSAMPITTSSLSTCSGSVPVGASLMTSFACMIVTDNGVCGSISSSHFMRSTLEAIVDIGPGVRSCCERRRERDHQEGRPCVRVLAGTFEEKKFFF